MFVVIGAVAVVTVVAVAAARWYTAPRVLSLRRERGIAVLLLAVPVVLLRQPRGIAADAAETGLISCAAAAVVGFGLGQFLRSSIQLAQDAATTFVRGGASYFALAMVASSLRIVLSQAPIPSDIAMPRLSHALERKSHLQIMGLAYSCFG